MAAKKVVAVVKQDEAAPVERGVLAAAILDIGVAMRKLLNSGVNKEAVIILCANRVRGHGRFSKKPGRRDIEAVFNALASLEREYCK